MGLFFLWGMVICHVLFLRTRGRWSLARTVVSADVARAIVAEGEKEKGSFFLHVIPTTSTSAREERARWSLSTSSFLRGFSIHRCLLLVQTEGVFRSLCVPACKPRRCSLSHREDPVSRCFSFFRSMKSIPSSARMIIRYFS